jgi:hypothetical protein
MFMGMNFRREFFSGEWVGCFLKPIEGDIPVNLLSLGRPGTRKEMAMAPEKEVISTAESLRSTRTYGKVRCHNPTCMERLEPKKGDKTIKCPTCGMEFRIAWVKDGFPRIRGPVWDANRKIAEEELARKLKEKEGK